MIRRKVLGNHLITRNFFAFLAAYWKVVLITVETGIELKDVT